MKKIFNTLLLVSAVSILTSFFFVGTDVPQNVHAQNPDQNANIIVEAVPDSSIASALEDRVRSSWPWYLTRASGLIAGLLLVLLMLSGTGFITGATFRFLEPITAWATHRAMGIALLVMVVLHVVALYFDEFVHFDVKSLIVPFASDYNPIELFGISVGSLYVALGIFALYIFIAVVLTSLFWIDKKPHTWKIVHILSYIAMVFIFVHALYLGTDLAGGLMRYVWVGAGGFVTLTIIQRLWRMYTV